MTKFILLVFLGFLIGCVQEIPIEELENESFVSGDSTSSSDEPTTPTPPKPEPEVVKTPQLLKITPEKAEYIAGTDSVTITVITDIKSHCRYFLGGAGYNVMTPMSKTDGVEHIQTITGFTDGDEKKYQVKCAEKSDSTEGFAYKYSEIKILKNAVVTLPADAPTPEITDLRFLGGSYFLDWKVDTSTVLGAPDGGFDTILNGKDMADRTAEILYTREYKNLDFTKKHCFRIEARWTEYIPSTGSGKGRVSNERCIDPQITVDMTAPIITSYEPQGSQYSDSTSSVTIKTMTDENANCRYSLSAALEYKDMTAFDTTGAKSHEHTFNMLKAGNHQYSVRCADNDMNVSNAVAPSFIIKEKVVVPQDRTLDELRADVLKIFNKETISSGRTVSCMGCHGTGGQYQSQVDLSVDIKVLEKIKKFITFKDPDNSHLYQKVSTGTMKKYIQSPEDLKTIYDWIKLVDGKDEIILNCAADEEGLDNVCVKKGKVIRSYGYRMITPEEMFKDINTIWNVNLTNVDQNSGQPIVPEPKTTHGFDNQFGLVSANSVYVNAIEEVANLLGDALEKKADFEPNTVSCMSDTIVNCGMAISNVYIPKLFRRNLTSEELNIYKDFFGKATGSKKEVYIKFFKALVQSPSFLFREEHGTNANPYHNLDAYEVASRMSYFITGRTPDADLRAKAKNGTILQKSVRETEARRLMQTSYGQQHLAETFMESIGIKKLAHSEAINNDMIRETRTLVRQIFFSDQPWTNIFNADYSYMNKRLADIYNISVNTDNNTFVKVDYPDEKRSGILAHGSYLSAFFDGKSIPLTKDIRRGINFYEKILCKSMPLPPPDVDIDLDPAADLEGCRIDKRKQSTTNPNGTCFQCHQHFDRIGMGFERFNNLGEYREVQEDDNKCSTIQDFYLDGATKFSTMPAFADAVSKNSNVQRCLALKMKSYAYGSDVSTAYVKPIFLEMDKFKTSMNFQDLIVDIVTNDQFAKREGRDEN